MILKLFICFGLFFAPSMTLAAGKTIIDSSGYAYDPDDGSCDGYPTLRVETMPGTCLGLAITQDQMKQSKVLMPRVILSLHNTNDFLLTDMGGWAPNKGNLFWLRRNGSEYDIVALKTKLNLPHGLVAGPDGFIYLGENQKITRFHFVNGKIKDEELVTNSLPAMKGDAHPLTQMTFSPVTGDLFINSGAPTDHCASSAGKPCAEIDSQDSGASIIMFTSQQLQKIPRGGINVHQVVAKGLRNSMAMAVTDDGRYLIQGENGRDFKEFGEPYEEMNLVRLFENGREELFTKHYGWPYCYDFNATSPEWANWSRGGTNIRNEFGEQFFDCAIDTITYQRPHSLLPPHSAPLHAEHYKGSMFWDLFGNQLLMSLHGYREAGQRFIAFPVDADGLPVVHTPNNDTFMVNQPVGCPTPQLYKPKGGFTQHASYTELISGWNAIDKVRPLGAPVGFTTGSDGSIWIVEDKNKTIVRLARSDRGTSTCSIPSVTKEDTTILFLAWRDAVKNDPQTLQGYEFLRDNLFPAAEGQPQVNKGYCTGCHENFRNLELSGKEDAFTFMDYMVRRNWLKPHDPVKSPIYNSIRQLGDFKPMPPLDNPQLIGTSDGEKVIQALEDWINILPKDISSRYMKATVAGNLNIREQPGKSARVCGQFLANDKVYIDPRPSTKKIVDGFTWSKVYVMPNSKRLIRGACPPILDGVYYMAYK